MTMLTETPSTLECFRNYMHGELAREELRCLADPANITDRIGDEEIVVSYVGSPDLRDLPDVFAGRQIKYQKAAD